MPRSKVTKKLRKTGTPEGSLFDWCPRPGCTGTLKVFMDPHEGAYEKCNKCGFIMREADFDEGQDC